jgi:hypothetical protein
MKEDRRGENLSARLVRSTSGRDATCCSPADTGRRLNQIGRDDHDQPPAIAVAELDVTEIAIAQWPTGDG